MKIFSTLTAAILLSISSFAGDFRPGSVVIVKSLQKAEIKVMLDGQLYELGTSAILIEGLESGTHDIHILEKDVSSRRARRSQEFRTAYRTTINLAEQSKLYINIEKDGYITKQENKMADQNEMAINRLSSKSNNDYFYQFDTEASNAAYINEMDMSAFNRVINAISLETTEYNRLKSATTIVNKNSLSTIQLEKMLQLFTNDANRLLLAKTAYDNIVDKENYLTIVRCFKDQDCHDDLSYFVNAREK